MARSATRDVKSSRHAVCVIPSGVPQTIGKSKLKNVLVPLSAPVLVVHPAGGGELRMVGRLPRRTVAFMMPCVAAPLCEMSNSAYVSPKKNGAAAPSADSVPSTTNVYRTKPALATATNGLEALRKSVKVAAPIDENRASPLVTGAEMFACAPATRIP